MQRPGETVGDWFEFIWSTTRAIRKTKDKTKIGFIEKHFEMSTLGVAKTKTLPQFQMIFS
jgi:hypothetical protein